MAFKFQLLAYFTMAVCLRSPSVSSVEEGSSAADLVVGDGGSTADPVVGDGGSTADPVVGDGGSTADPVVGDGGSTADPVVGDGGSTAATTVVDDESGATGSTAESADGGSGGSTFAKATASTITTTPMVTSAAKSDPVTTISSPETTPTPSTTTTTPPVVGNKPPNFENVEYKLNFTLPFHRKWTGPINQTTDEFKTLKADVERTIKEGFTGCPGYKLCNVTNFSSFNVTDNSTSLTKSTTKTVTNAEYFVSFDSQVVTSDNGASITDFIKNNASTYLSTANVTSDGQVYPVDESVVVTMNEEVDEQGDVFNQSVCVMGAEACDPCYWCNSQAKNRDEACIMNCSAAEHKYCQILSNTDSTIPWVYTCSCEPGYLPVGSDCVSDDLIIGLSAGIGAAVLICMTAAIIYFACRKPSHSSGKSDTKSLAANEAQLIGSDEEIDKKSSPGADIPAAVVVAAAAAAVNPDDVGVDVKSDDGHAVAAAMAVTAAAVGVGTAAGAVVVAAAVVEQQPNVAALSQSRNQLDVMEPDYDLAKPMPLNTQYFNNNDIEMTYSTFVPQLQNVDTQGNYSIRRPVSVKAATSHSQPGPHYQNPSYRDFF